MKALEDSLAAAEAAVHSKRAHVCRFGGVDDGTLRVCCSTHKDVLCAYHYARTHFVETDPAWNGPACHERVLPPLGDPDAGLRAD
jgi:hypothetical protein